MVVFEHETTHCRQTVCNLFAPDHLVVHRDKISIVANDHRDPSRSPTRSYLDFVAHSAIDEQLKRRDVLE
jgi:hypothetical protein